MTRIIFIILIFPFLAHGQSNKYAGSDLSIGTIKSLLLSKKIVGTFYSDKRIMLPLTDTGSTQEYLIDSVSHLKYINPKKISFICYFNDAASDIKVGYIEINFSPYKTKLVFLSDILVSTNFVRKNGIFSTYIVTKSHMRYGESTIFRHKIVSRCKSAELFTYSYTHKNIVGLN
jgi:hypothetical protein